VNYVARQVARIADQGGPVVLPARPFGTGPLSFTPHEAGLAPPAVAPVPKVWRVPSRNPQFTGRAPLLAALAEGFRGMPGFPPSPQALVGIGGVGKTQTAVEYAHRVAAEYDLVWYVDASQPELVPRELAELAGPLGLNAGDDIPAPPQPCSTRCAAATPAHAGSWSWTTPTIRRRCASSSPPDPGMCC
jgi:hypothetical protein